MTGAEIRAQLSLNNKDFLRGMAQSMGAAKQFAGNLPTVALTTFTAGLVGAGAAAAIAGTAFFAATRKATELGGVFSDMRGRTGGAVSELALISQALKNAGMETDDVGNSISKLQKAIAAADPIFSKLGMDFSKLVKLSPTQQLMTVGKAIASVKDPTLQTAASMEIFGKSGSRLLAAFKDDSALKSARLILGSMPELLEASADSLDNLGDLLESFPTKWAAFSVGLTSGFSSGMGDSLKKIMSIDSALIGKGLADDLATAISGQTTTQAIANLSKTFFDGMFATINGLADILQGSLMNALAEPLAAVQALYGSLYAKVINASQGKGISEAEEIKLRTLKADRVAGQEHIKRLTPEERQGPLGKSLAKFINDVSRKISQLEERRGQESDVGKLFAEIVSHGGPQMGFSKDALNPQERIQKGVDDWNKAMTNLLPATAQATVSSVKSALSGAVPAGKTSIEQSLPDVSADPSFTMPTFQALMPSNAAFVRGTTGMMLPGGAGFPAFPTASDDAGSFQSINAASGFALPTFDQDTSMMKTFGNGIAKSANFSAFKPNSLGWNPGLSGPRALYGKRMITEGSGDKAKTYNETIRETVARHRQERQNARDLRSGKTKEGVDQSNELLSSLLKGVQDIAK